MRAIRYDTLTQTWERGDNFVAYLTYTIRCMLATDAKTKVHSLLSKDQIKRVDTDLDSVVKEMLQDKATVKTLRRIWRGNKDAVHDFIMNSGDDE